MTTYLKLDPTTNSARTKQGQKMTKNITQLNKTKIKILLIKIYLSRFSSKQNKHKLNKTCGQTTKNTFNLKFRAHEAGIFRRPS